MSAPRPANERERLATLRRFQVLDTEPEQALDELVGLAAQIFEVPIALVSLVDEDRQWFKSKLGIEFSETSRDFSFCAHAILQDGVFEVEDAKADERFSDNPLVTGDPGVRFYAGAPLASEGGYKLGTLCVIDRRPRRLSQRQKEILVVLARAVSAQLELRSALERGQSEAEERARIESRLRRTTGVLRAMHEVQSQVLAGLELPAAFERILEALLELTESEYGFIGEILADAEGQPFLKTHAITNIAWNEDTRRFYDENAPTGMEFRSLRTLFGEVMTSGAPVVANDPASDPRRGGLPSGHPPLNCFLGVPFSSGPRPSGMIGVANAPAGYDDSVIEMLEPLLGACASMMGFARLERARQVAEVALRESEERFRQVLENSLDAVVGIDSMGCVRTWNRQAERIFGWSIEEATGEDLSAMIVPPRFREAHRRG